MFDGVMIDVAIGMLLIFLVSSLMASAAVEAVGGFLHRRSKNLWDTIDLMLGRATFDADGRRVVDLVYEHQLIRTLVRPTSRVFFEPTLRSDDPEPGIAVAPRAGIPIRGAKEPPRRARWGLGQALGADEQRRRFYGPQAIEGREFADALVEVLAGEAKVLDTTSDLRETVDALPDGPLKADLSRLMVTGGSTVATMRTAIEEWYERHMSAVSLWYRKQTRWFLFAAGLMMAVGLNVNAIGAITTLYRDDEVRASLIEQAGSITEGECQGREDAAAQVDCVRDRLGGAVELPVGWGDRVDTTGGAWVLRVLGWLVIAVSVTVGAPFWFDLLRRATTMRS